MTEYTWNIEKNNITILPNKGKNYDKYLTIQLY